MQELEPSIKMENLLIKYTEKQKTCFVKARSRKPWDRFSFEFSKVFIILEITALFHRRKSG